MTNKSSLRRIAALCLALCFTTAWSLNTLHDLLLHHPHPVCEAAYDGKGTHIHDERYEGHGCTLCALLLSAPELTARADLLALTSKLPDSESPDFYTAPVRPGAMCGSTLLRGPPVG
ncbi:MAG TPA: hypothetical protein PK228_09755 [Saprospiraceae bacterium]|nr:hypothetical protein [Saprospiraceae bacterium]